MEGPAPEPAGAANEAAAAVKKEGEEATEATTSSFPPKISKRPRPKKKQLTHFEELKARGHVRAIPFHERFFVLQVSIFLKRK